MAGHLQCQLVWKLPIVLMLHFEQVHVLDVTYLFHRKGYVHKNTGLTWCTRNAQVLLCSFQNKLKIKLKTCIFTERHVGPGCFKNKWMPNNVFDVLYLNLYAYLHYSYFPGLGTNPIDMEMGCSVSWQSWGERKRKRERENSQVRSYSKCAENRFWESTCSMVLVIGDYTNHLKFDEELQIKSIL